ncbi:MAG: pentapeptide repeat-containing protein [Rectinemataceae bacterium]
MYSLRPCIEPGCGKSVFHGEDRCIDHLASPEETQARIVALITGSREHRNLNLAGVKLSGLDLSAASFICCSFMGATLTDVNFSGTRFRLVFFDGAEISSCNFSSIDAQFCSFGASKILACVFKESELLHLNFSGARIEECTFNNSNLYDSRFIKTELVMTTFMDCDLKRVHLIPSAEVGVSYRHSNTAEAVRDLEHVYQ